MPRGQTAMATCGYHLAGQVYGGKILTHQKTTMTMHSTVEDHGWVFGYIFLNNEMFVITTNFQPSHCRKHHQIDYNDQARSQKFKKNWIKLVYNQNNSREIADNFSYKWRKFIPCWISNGGWEIWRLTVYIILFTPNMNCGQDGLTMVY